MAYSQHFLWLVLVGVILTALTIVFIFIFINICISKRESERRRIIRSSSKPARRRAQISRQQQTNTYQENNNKFTPHTDVEKAPPLPSRDQFIDTDNNKFTPHTDVEKAPPLPSRDQFIDTESMSHSYEDMPTRVDSPEANQTSAPPLPAFIQSPETQLSLEDSKSLAESYDDVEQLDHNVDQSYEDVASLPDYLDLEEDISVLQQPPEFCNPAVQPDSRESLASYDDVDALDNASEDYDDVG